MDCNAAALEAAGLVGTWVTDVGAGLSVIEGRAADLLAGDADLAGRAITLDFALRCIHPEDRDRIFGQIRRVRASGGPFSAEFRVINCGGNVRWILNRGRVERDRDGAMRGCGAYLDITDQRRNPVVVPFDAPAAQIIPRGLQDPLDQAAEQCLRAHEAVARSGHGSLRLFADMLLLEVGRALAGRGCR